MKSFIKEFKEFISNGNVMSMAIGIIIGGAFTAIVNSLVADIITPLIGMILGGINFSGISITVGSAQLMVGNFIQAVIMFVLTALVIFVMMKGLNKLAAKKKAADDAEEAAAPAEPSDEVKLLMEIRDALNK
ncbi:mechanosensitive ion channel protein MscL [Eubacterium sulci ATCC 35585]|jgi:large conductance mechanosensitive channel protein|nr:mechanosensitive ion channel protein MscL [Eubacterium sulci ATCC 35585]MBF1138563.1 large conductance mechanosensitive channel protein MscL [[Eubacterium] sulci]EUC78198.1 large conductance mechanosensitive channel protein [Eubacterium sulci ATCC 35585]MBF1147566.1 large conductance mechanosensitive channel protein MscL [[Eubacterium] sulci]MBF1151005.1 large conductance mechanosensitive channel protein MscL [[Eubacterium] sulci]